MGKKKPWIDKKNSTTFRLVYRSQRDDGVESPLFVPKQRIPRKIMKSQGLKELVKNQPNKRNLIDELDDDELKQFQDAEEIQIEEEFEEGEFDDADELETDEEKEEDKNESKAVEKPKEEKKRFKYRPDDYEYGDLGFPDDGYDYSQHFKKHDGETVFITARGTPTQEDKKLFLSTPKAFNPQPSMGEQEEIDPEILEALNQDFDDAEEGAREVGDLPDNFLELAGGEDTLEEQDQTTLTLPTSKDEFKISKNKKKKIGKIIELPPATDYQNPTDSTYLNERFARIADTYREEDIGDLEEEEIRGTINVNSIKDLLDEFESSLQPVKISQADDEPSLPEPSSTRYTHQNFNNVLASVNKKNKQELQNQEDVNDVEDEDKVDEDESEEEYEVLEVSVKSDWDCQSLVSTYSNTENHPKLIKEPPASAFKIPLSSKTGIPLGVLPPHRPVKKIVEKVSLTNFNHPDPALLKTTPQTLTKEGLQRFEKKPNEQEDELEDDDDQVSVSSVSTTVSLRPPNETPEERRLRKQQTKLLRKQNRERKKALKQRYQQEDLRLKNIAAQQPLQKASILSL